MLITINQICGHLAMWVCRQHPYHTTEHVDTANSKLREAAKEHGFEGDDLPMRHFKDVRQITQFLEIVLDNSPEVRAWNRPRDGNLSPFAFFSRYTRPSVKSDFIDISALFCNIARSVWVEELNEQKAEGE